MHIISGIKNQGIVLVKSGGVKSMWAVGFKKIVYPKLIKKQLYNGPLPVSFIFWQ